MALFKSEDGDFSVSSVVFTFLLEMKMEMSIKHLETILWRLLWLLCQGCWCGPPAGTRQVGQRQGEYSGSMFRLRRGVSKILGNNHSTEIRKEKGVLTEERQKTCSDSSWRPEDLVSRRQQNKSVQEVWIITIIKCTGESGKIRIFKKREREREIQISIKILLKLFL